MTTTAIAERPTCSKGHGYMDLRTSTTKEQAWCGTWYDCTNPHCRDSVLLPSPELATPECPHLAEWMDAAMWAPLCKICKADRG